MFELIVCDNRTGDIKRVLPFQYSTLADAENAMPWMQVEMEREGSPLNKGEFIDIFCGVLE